MSGFPNLSNIQPEIAEAILTKANSNYALSGLMPWFRLVTLNGSGAIANGGGRGLVIDSLSAKETFGRRYGNLSHAGIVGLAATDFSPVYAGIDDSDTDYVGREKRGLRPSPTVESFTIENGTEGLTRKAKFTIRTYTVSQADSVSAHFLEPGAYVLLEWGWNVPQSLQQRAGTSNGITDCDLIYYNNLGILKDKRAASNGTYDALLAVVTGGGMKYADGEAYDIEVELTSPGELPAYLRAQKGQILSRTAVKSGIKFTQGELDEMSDKEMGDVGKFLFMQMYNELPLNKQIGPIKKLVLFDELTDSSGRVWYDPANFINMDNQIREDLVEEAKDDKIRSADGSDLRVPEDVPLMSSDRFIRFELAYKIFATDAYGENQPSTGCPEYVLQDGTGKKLKGVRLEDIHIEDTVCRAFKHMFSVDKSKLYIPNTQLPDFKLIDALRAADFPSGSIEPLEAPDFGPSGIVNGHPKPDGLANSSDTTNEKTRYAFPATVDGLVLDYSWDSTINPPLPKAHEHGMLKNLYINFDFFLQVIQSPGLYAHEALMELLNGMSSAANFYWDFQIVETGQPGTGNSCLKVIDANYLGVTVENVTPNEQGIPEVIKTEFYTQGIKSPFLNVNLDIDIPGGLMNQIMAQRGSSLPSDDGETVDSNTAGFTSSESKQVNLETGLFSKFEDPVANKIKKLSDAIADQEEELNEIREKEFKQKSAETKSKRKFWSRATLNDIGASLSNALEKGVELAKEIKNNESAEATEARKTNYKYFIEKAGVFPRENDRNKPYDITKQSIGGWISYDLDPSNNANVEQILYVGVWEDPSLLKKYELNEIQKSNGKDNLINPPLTSIGFEFQIHGISGLKVGDIFRVADLPYKFNNKIFQITEINHQVGEQWITSVKSKLRNI